MPVLYRMKPLASFHLCIGVGSRQADACWERGSHFVVLYLKPMQFGAWVWF